MDNKNPEEQSKNPEPQHFKSNFKTWIRIVAFIVVAVFLPEQVAQVKKQLLL